MRTRRLLIAPLALAIALASLAFPSAANAETGASAENVSPQAYLGELTLTYDDFLPKVTANVRPGDDLRIKNPNGSPHVIYGGTAVITYNGNPCTASSRCVVPQYGFIGVLVVRPGTVFGASAGTYEVLLEPVKPSAPRDVQAVAGDASATVSWQPPDDTQGFPIVEYRALAIPGAKQCITTGALTCVIPGLANGTPYTVQVTAMNSIGGIGVSSGVGPVTPSGPPSTPVLTTAWDAATGVMTVAWGPYDWAGNTPGSFKVEYRYRSGPWRDFNNTASPLAESAQFTTLSAGTPVEFRVTAAAQDGTTSTPGTASATIPNPGVPLTIVAGDTKADFSWSPVTGADHYILSWYEWAPGTPGGTARIDTCSGPCTYSLTGLTNGTQYRAKVNAIAANGRAVAVTDPDPYFTPNSPAPAALPTPSVALSLTGTTARLDWAPYRWGTYTPKRFRIRWTTDGGTTWNIVDNASSPLATATTVTGLQPGLTATFRVEAEADSGAVSPPGSVSAVVPSPPVLFTLAAVPGDGQAVLTWNVLPEPGLTYRVVNQSGSMPTPPTPTPCSATSGTCSFTVTGLTNGTTYRFAVEAFGPTTVAPLTNSVTVTPLAPAAPLDVVYPVQANLQVGRPITISPDAQYSSGNPTSFTEGSTPLPSGLHLDPRNGDITGTPRQAVDGLYPIKVANAAGQTLTVPLRLIIGPHTVSLNYADVSGHVGTPLTLTPHTSSVIGTMTDYRITSGTLPAGMSLDRTTGVISGTPTAATTGPVALTVTARDDYATARASFSITVDSGAAALTLGYPNVVAHVGKAQGVTPTVSGATGTLAFSLTSGTLPAGLTLNAATGVISGTPTTAQGAQPITVQVTDGNATDDVTFTIEVIAHTLSLAYPSSSRDIGVPAQLSPVVSHVEGTVSYAITSGTLPAGLTLNPATGVISGTPTAVTSGPVPLEITATDSYASAIAAFTLEVTDPTPPRPIIDATLTRDANRLHVIGLVTNAPDGASLIPMIRLSGQTTFSPGRPISLDDRGSFRWNRRIGPQRGLGTKRRAAVYFVIAGTQSATLRAERPRVTVSGSQQGRTVRVLGSTANISAGSIVHARITRLSGSGRLRADVRPRIRLDGSFTWERTLRPGQRLTVVFYVRGVKSASLTF